MAAVCAMGDVVIKPIFGSMGHGLVRVSDPDLAFRVVRSLEQLRSVFYVQRVIDHCGTRHPRLRRRRSGARRDRATCGRWRLAHQRRARRAARPFEVPPAWEAARASCRGGDRR